MMKANSRIILLKAGRSLFGHIIVMEQAQSLKMEDILIHPLGPLPWALATPNGLPKHRNDFWIGMAEVKCHRE